MATMDPGQRGFRQQRGASAAVPWGGGAPARMPGVSPLPLPRTGHRPGQPPARMPGVPFWKQHGPINDQLSRMFPHGQVPPQLMDLLLLLLGGPGGQIQNVGRARPDMAREGRLNETPLNLPFANQRDTDPRNVDIPWMLRGLAGHPRARPDMARPGHLNEWSKMAGIQANMPMPQARNGLSAWNR